MKKIISVILAICFVAGMFCLPVAAAYTDLSSTPYIQVGTSAHDLGAYGLHTFSSYYVGVAPTLDGVISDGEYNSTNIPSDVATVGDGLSLTNSLGSADYTKEFGKDYEDFTIKSYLAYDDTYAYIAEEITSTQGIDLGSTSILNANVRYGLNQSDAIPEAAGRLSNSYSFTVDSSVTTNKLTSADRTYKKLDGAVTSTVQTDIDPYNDGTTVWTREEYGKSENATAAVSNAGGKETYVLEFRIPLADLIYSATGRYSKDDVSALLAKGAFYGSYFFQVSVTRSGGADQNRQFFLSTGYAANTEILPYSSSSETVKASTWAQAVKEYWTTAKGESLAVTNIASPILHNAKTTAAPSTPSVIPTTGFRPGLTGYGLKEVKSVYKLGETATITVTPDGIENTAPAVGDVRIIPTKLRIRNGFDTKFTGKFNADFKTASFKTDSLPVGLNTLVVTFTQQRFDGTNWVDTGVSKNLSRNFTLTGSVKAASQAASQTGDSVTLIALSGTVMLLAAGVVSVVILRKRKSF